MELQLLHIQFTNWGMDLTSYMGDVYLPYRTFIATWSIVLGVIIYKRKKRK
jgi:hypothetical protein